MMKLNRFAIALGASLTVHAACLLWLRRHRVPGAEAPAELVRIEVSFSKATPEEPPEPTPSPDRTTVKRPARVRRGFDSKVAKAAPPGRGEERGLEKPTSSAAADSPRSVTLFPDTRSWRGMTQPGPAPEPGGRTTRAGDEPHLDPSTVAAVAAEKAENMKRMVDGWIDDEMATQRVATGVVDAYFGSMKKALEDGAQNPPPFDSHPLRGLAAGWAAAAQRYGETGNPYPQEREGRRGLELASPLDRARQQFPGTRYEGFAKTLEQGAALRKFADGPADGLVAILEFRQASDGKLLSTLLLRSSGDKVFDTHVLRTAPESIARIGLPRVGAAGIHPEGIRSAWAFEGRVVYRKKARDIHLEKDWWYFAASAPLALITGNFDETTGDVYVVDLHDPKYTLAVRLLRVY